MALTAVVNDPAPSPTPAPPAPATGVQIDWERHGIGQRNWTGIAQESKSADGESQLTVAARTNSLFHRDPKFDATDRYDLAVGREALAMVREKTPALYQSLGRSNITFEQWEKNTVRPGEFALALQGKDRQPLYYVGLLKAAPQPVSDLISGIEQLRSRL